MLSVQITVGKVAVLNSLSDSIGKRLVSKPLWADSRNPVYSVSDTFYFFCTKQSVIKFAWLGTRIMSELNTLGKR